MAWPGVAWGGVAWPGGEWQWVVAVRDEARRGTMGPQQRLAVYWQYWQYWQGWGWGWGWAGPRRPSRVEVGERRGALKVGASRARRASRASSRALRSVTGHSTFTPANSGLEHWEPSLVVELVTNWGFLKRNGV